MRLRSALFLATSAIPLALTSCAAALSWDGFADGTVASEGGKESSTKDDSGVNADTGTQPDTSVDAPVKTPIAVVQENSGGGPNNATEVKAAFITQPQTKGNMILVAVGWYEPTTTITDVKDSLGNKYTKAVGPTTKVAGPGDDVIHSMYFAPGIAAAAAGANTVTVTFSGASDGPDIRIVEYAGLDPVSPFDKAVDGSGLSNLAQTAPLTTTVPRTLLVSAGSTFESYDQPGTGFVVRSKSQQSSIVQDRVVDAIGTYTATAPIINDAQQSASAEWVLQLAAFH